MAVTPNSIITPQSPRSQAAVCNAAKTTYADGANTVSLFVAGPNGARVTRVWAIPRANVPATQLQLYKAPAGGSAAPFLYRTALMSLYNISGATEAPVTDFGFSDDNPLIMKANEELYCAVGQAANVVFHAEGADY